MTTPEPQLNTPAAPPAAETKPCISCGAALNRSARVCTVCKEYQEGWRNEFKYWAGVAGLLTLVGSGITFSWSAIKAGKDYQFPPAPVVAEMNTFGNLSVLNVSGQTLWLRNLAVKSSNPGSDLHWELGAIVKPRELIDIPLTPLSAAQFADLSKDLYGQKHGAYAVSLDPVTEQQIMANQHRLRYTAVYLRAEGPEDMQVKRFLEKTPPPSFTCTAALQVMYADSQRYKDVSIPCVGYIKNRIDPKSGD
jgi:hypothetical protein